MVGHGVVSAARNIPDSVCFGVGTLAVVALAVVVALDLTAECGANIWWPLFALRRPLEGVVVLVVGHGVASGAPNIPECVCFGVDSLAVAALAVEVALDLRESTERVAASIILLWELPE